MSKQAKQEVQMVLETSDWEPSAVRYMQPKVNASGGKSINVISTQTGRALHLSTPLMMTWGISDFTNDQGESDGKFYLTLVFPNKEYTNERTDEFLQKFKDFENQIIDDAVKHSDAWFGEQLDRSVVKHSFFPSVKYQKDKLTKKLDMSKPPQVKARVPNYNNKWSTQIYDPKQVQLFPSENENLTPMDFVPKMAKVATVLQCGGLWFGGKGWGLTWKVNQIVVKPIQVTSVYDKCYITLAEDDLATLDKGGNEEQLSADPLVDTKVEDSDDDADEDEPVEEEKPVPAPKKKVVKKAAPVEDSADEELEAPAPKKKVVRKKAVAAA